MAVILDTKPRIRLPPVDTLEVRSRRTRNWLPCYALLWVGAAVIGHGIMYGWLPVPHGSRSPAPVAVSRSAQTPVELAPPAIVHSVQSLPTATVESTGILPQRAADWSNLPSCESVLDEASETETRRNLPVDLARSAVGVLLDFNRWTVPCRTNYLSRVHLCLAIREGVVIGATAHAEPRDESIERCIVRAATLVPLQSESVVRKVQLEIPLGRAK